MARSDIPMLINLRQNTNDESTAYGKYFAEAERKEPINLKGFCRHMTEHGKIASWQMCELVVKQMVDCLKELVCQGQPVKIDGLGTFYTTIENARGGCDKKEEFNVNKYLKALHIRFLPEQEQEQNLSSREFIKQAEFINVESLAKTEETTPANGGGTGTGD